MTKSKNNPADVNALSETIRSLKRIQKTYPEWLTDGHPIRNRLDALDALIEAYFADEKPQ